MKARVDSARTTLRHHVRLSIALLGLSLAVLVLFVSGSGANLALPNTFEGDDGNLVVNAAGATDWANVSPVINDDVPSGSNDNSFGQGTKEDDPNVTIVTGSIPPNKNDLTRSYFSTKSVGGHTYLYLAWERAVNTGSANLDFELDQNATPNWSGSTTGAVTINRTEGDLLITYDFGGSGTPDIGLLTWLTAGNGHSDSDCFASGQKLPCWGDHVDLSASGFAVGAVNTGDITDPLLNGGTTLSAGLFGEAAIDLSAVPGGPFTQDTCASFGTEFVKSRASGSSIDAELKDFIAPGPIHLSNCGSVKIVKDAQPDSSQSFGYTADTSLVPGGSFSLVDDGTGTNNSKEIKNVKPGTYTVSENGSLPAGWALTGLTCDDPSSDSTTSGSTATIKVGSNEDITCTYTNTYTKASPTLATLLSNLGPVAVGSTVHDSASFTGYRAPATGTSTVTYTVYDNNTCTSNANDVNAGTVNVNKTTGQIPDSNPVTFNNAGDYYWQASFSGDDANNAVTSPCLSEHLVVNKAKPTIATQLSSESITVGGSVHDSSTLSGSTANAGGTVSYKVYDNNTCTQNANTVDAGTKTVTNHLVPDSDPVTFNNAGDYYWQASYSGDSNNEAATSPCLSEHLVVNKAKPTIATQLSADTVTVGASVHDSSTLTGATANAGGTVVYTVYSNNTCTAMFASGGTKTVTNGVVPDSNPVTFGTAGDYYWQAAYSGDSNNEAATSPCLSEHLVVNKAKPTIATQLSSESIAVGGTVHDSSTLTGATATAGGTVTYKVYDNNTCTQNANTVDAGTKTVTNHLVPDSNPVTFNNAGDYYWQASYSGDANNAAATSPCLSEHLVVGKAKPTIATQLSDESITVGGSVHDSSTLTGATATAGGTVNYKVYDNNTCTQNANTVDAGTKTVTNHLVPDSNPVTFNVAGDYYWQASYSGDSNNEAATSPCLSEHLVVNKATPSAATTLHNAAGDAVVANGTHLPLGSSLYDVASLTGVDGIPFSGTVTFNFFKNAACTGEPFATQTGASITGSSATSSTRGPLGAGSYAFNATYVAGNDPSYNSSAVSECEPFVVDKAQPGVTTAVHDADHNDVTNKTILVGSSVHDTAHVSGGVEGFPTGNVTFTLYTGPNCMLASKVVATDGTESGDVRSVSEMLLAAGTYGFKATVAGNDNYLAAEGACEPFVVAAPAITIAKNPATQAVNSGGTANFTITVTNTGTVTLTNVTVTDPLSTGCNKVVGTLDPGQSSTYTCSQSGVTAAFTNVATVTGHPPVGPDVTASASANVTVNPPPSSPETPTPTPTPAPPTVVDLAIVKTVDKASVVKGSNVTYTLTVTNNGPVTDTNVQVADSLPVGVTYVSSSSSQGTCSGTAVVQCNIGTMTNGQKVTITIVVNTVNTGTIANTATVVGALPETTLSNNTSSVSFNVTAPPAPKEKPKPVFKPPVVKPKPKPVPPPCYAVVVAPKSLTVGKNAHLQLHVTAKDKSLAGVKILVKGAGILKVSNRTDKSGHVTMVLHPKKPGIVLVKPAAYKGCTNPRIGVVAAFTPPVTG